MRNRNILLSSKEAANALKITRQTLSRYNLPHSAKVKIGGKTYYKEREIEMIKSVGLDKYIDKMLSEPTDPEWNDIISKGDFEAVIDDLRKMLTEILICEQWEYFLRFAYLGSELHAMTELIQDSEYTAVFETEYNDGKSKYWDLDFYAAQDDYDKAVLAMAQLANDPDNGIIRYNILPTAIFRPLYDEYLFQSFAEKIDETPSENKNQVLQYMLPFKAQKDKKYPPNNIVVEAKKIANNE